MYFDLYTCLTMSFKPNRDKLNANFDGYKLGKQTLPCVSQPFEEGVRIARLKEEDFSYQHVRAFSLCNHLAVDPWDEHSVYWCTKKCAILKGRYTVSCNLQGLWSLIVVGMYYSNKLTDVFFL